MESKINKVGMSLVICCFNSGWVIERTLDALTLQKFDFPTEFEIILVDNNSTDNTNALFEIFKRNNLGIQIKIVSENKPGLSNARIAGYRAATYSIIVYCDDDTVLSSRYLTLAKELMDKNPDMGLCGGLGTPVFESDPDPRILPFLDQYATGPQGEGEFCDITKRGFVYGAGMVIRKEALDKLFARGFEFSTPGRKGAQLTGGEDVELGHAITAIGYRCYYSAKLNYKHILPARRLTWAYLKRMAYGNGYTSVNAPNLSTLFTLKGNPIYFSLWICFQVAKQATLLFIAQSNDSTKLRFWRSCGAFQCMCIEFPTLFKKRKKLQKMYTQLIK